MGSQFIADRCAVIDRVGTNLLIRGNMPLLGEDNHYALKEIQAASGVADLLTRTIINVPIIDNVGECEQFSALCLAFGIDPARFPETMWPPYGKPGYKLNSLLGHTLTTEGECIKGSMVWRPFEGLPAGEAPGPYITAPLWDFSGFVENVIEMLANLENTAIYVHCQLGADRTGAFHIGYLMKTRDFGFYAASAIANESTQAGAPNADYLRLAKAYADWLLWVAIFKQDAEDSHE